MNHVKTTERILNNKLGLLISSITPDYIVEVGCYDGEFLKRLNSFSPYSIPVGFEANPNNFFPKCLGKNIQHMAISDNIGTTTIYGPKNVPGKGELRLPKSSSMMTYVNVKEYDRYVVNCNTLDSFFEIPIRQGKTFVLLIDVEGASYQVLSGADKFLNNTLAIKVEVETQETWKGQKLEKDVHDLLKNRFTLAGSGRKDLKTMSTQHENYYVRDMSKMEYFISDVGYDF